MDTSLTLEADDVRDPHHWFWRLKGPRGQVLATHEVKLDPHAWEFGASLDLYAYIEKHAPPDRREAEEKRLVHEIGRWLGENVLGEIGPKILASGTPVTVRVVVPGDPKAEGLQFLPLELAHVDGKPLALQDVSLVFEVTGDTSRDDRSGKNERLRMLAVFSLPVGESALNLRHERHQLQTRIRSIARDRGRAIDLRVLQYGVTREALTDILKQRGGWDVIHFSGHGLAAGLVLEKADGTADLVPSDELIDLLRPGRARLKWVTLSACSSAARTVAETLQWLGLEPKRQDKVAAEGSQRELPAVARALVASWAVRCSACATRWGTSSPSGSVRRFMRGCSTTSCR